MKVINNVNEAQGIKKQTKSTEDMVSYMKSHAIACSGECNDCVGCGGSITH